LLETPPDWMNAGQKDCWDYAITHMPRGLLHHIDRGALAVWVVAEDLHRRAVEAQNQASGLLVKSPNGGPPQQSPFLAIINRQAVIMLKAASELGFSPVARPRIVAAGLDKGIAAVGAMATSGAPTESIHDFLARAPHPLRPH
jgi:P27 family predicted phage terminase small subunit